MATDFGTDVSTYPDLDLSFAPITGQQVLVEAVMRRLETDRGSLPFAPDYGIGIRSWLNESLTQRRVDELVAMVISECLADERIGAADVAASWSRPTETLKLTIAITPADGVVPAFQLVLAVTAVTIDVLSLG